MQKFHILNKQLLVIPIYLPNFIVYIIYVVMVIAMQNLVFLMSAYQIERERVQVYIPLIRDLYLYNFVFPLKKRILNTQVAHHQKRAMTLPITLECAILILQLPRNNKRLGVQTKAIKNTIFPSSSLSLMSYITEASNVDPSHEKNNKLFY